MDLPMFFTEHPAVALGFSGGVDSAYLLCAALSNGARVTPYFVKTAFQPAFELDDARRVCALLHAELTVIELDVLSQPAVVSNPPDRCYHCKKQIFNAITERARADGFDTVIDGTNASDDAGDRPGMRALAELGVYSPLRECGLSKTAVRRLSKEAGLFTWDKPSYACLATRAPAGQAITPALLTRVEAAEAALSALGFSDFRVRVEADGSARLCFVAAQMADAVVKREVVLAALAPYFTMVSMDLAARKTE